MIGSNFDTKSKNIDNLIDMLIDVQKENGIEPTMREALFDPVTKERVNRFKRKRLEKAGVDLTEYGETPSKCSGCNKGCKDGENHISNIERGVFVYNENDLIDEEEGDYVCEFCTKIGHKAQYQPDICDTCDDCEGCTDYASGSCDGCGYSVTYNGGYSYGQTSNVSTELKSEDSLLLEDISNGGPDYDVEKPDGGFTIMNY